MNANFEICRQCSKMFGTPKCGTNIPNKGCVKDFEGMVASTQREIDKLMIRLNRLKYGLTLYKGDLELFGTEDHAHEIEPEEEDITTECMKLQSDYASKLKVPMFVPPSGMCFHCRKPVFGKGGYSKHQATTELITGCHRCGQTFCD